jgi:hypothetical protein
LAATSSMAAPPLPLRRSTWLPAAFSRVPGWFNGYGIAPAEHASFTPPSATQPSSKKCYYVLDVLLCD